MTPSNPGTTATSTPGQNPGSSSLSSQAPSPGLNPEYSQDRDRNRENAMQGSEEISPATSKLAAAAHSAVDIAAQNFAQAEKALREARVAAGIKVSETAEHAHDYSEAALADMKAYVERYPMRSVGIALATGFLLSAVLHR